MRFSLSIIVLLLASVPAMAQDAPKAVPTSYPMAGLHPDQRPEGAPVIRDVQRPKDWDKRVVHGIATPIPPHLGIADLGAWYTPFTRPGMPARYDLRGWHPTGKVPAGKVSNKGSKRKS